LSEEEEKKKGKPSETKSAHARERERESRKIIREQERKEIAEIKNRLGLFSSV
jgi:hypothetical protein